MGKKTIYMSFCDAKKPEGSQFLGACLVYANDLREAIEEAWRLGCNPGGEIMSAEPDFLPDEKWYNRLLSEKEIDQMSDEVIESRAKGVARKA